MTGKIELSKDIKMRIFKYKSNSKSKLFKKNYYFYLYIYK